VNQQSSQTDSDDGLAETTEYLLVFQTLAVYADQQGRKTRDREIMYPAEPTFISKLQWNSIDSFRLTFTSLYSTL
jgi:hypothetical protein